MHAISRWLRGEARWISCGRGARAFDRCGFRVRPEHIEPGSATRVPSLFCCRSWREASCDGAPVSGTEGPPAGFPTENCRARQDSDAGRPALRPGEDGSARAEPGVEWAAGDADDVRTFPSSRPGRLTWKSSIPGSDSRGSEASSASSRVEGTSSCATFSGWREDRRVRSGVSTRRSTESSTRS